MMLRVETDRFPVALDPTGTYLLPSYRDAIEERALARRRYRWYRIRLTYTAIAQYVGRARARGCR
jgi:hypothetical protein